MTPEALARLHARCFQTTPPLERRGVRGPSRPAGVPPLAVREGFALGRSVAGEAELLTLAVAPEARRKGLGRRLTAAFEDEARASGAEEAFLEVSAENAPARALYAALGWRAAGIRRGYFGPGLDAIVLRKDLLPPDAKA